MSARHARVALPRHAFGPAEQARPVDLWRILQDVAVDASAAVGWPPARYAAAGTGFVVSEAVVLHHRPLVWGEPVDASTWVADFRRGMLTRRDIRLEVSGEAVVSSSHQWVHVGVVDGATRPVRAPDALLASFDPGGDEAACVLPAVDPEDGPGGTWEMVCPFYAVDPLNHANHPWYVGWCDEALACALAAGGHDPYAMRAVAERVRFRGGVRGGDPVVVAWARAGSVTGAVAWRFTLSVRGVVAAEATLIRAHSAW